MRLVKSAFISMLFSVLAGPLVAVAGDILPPGCYAEDWCVKKVTDCFVGYVAQPGGFYEAHAQYSVLRKIQAVCQSYYGQKERRVILGPVEPVEFTSGISESESYARASVLQLCETYRADWLSAAPNCN